MTIAPRKFEVQLMVDHHQLKSADLEKLLMMASDECWDVGQSYIPSPGASEQRYRFSRWALRSEGNSIDDMADVMQILTQRISLIERNFHLLPKDSKVSLTLFVTETDTVIGMGLSAEVIKLLARINAGIEVSLIITGTDD